MMSLASGSACGRPSRWLIASSRSVCLSVCVCVSVCLQVLGAAVDGQAHGSLPAQGREYSIPVTHYVPLNPMQQSTPLSSHSSAHVSTESFMLSF